MYFADVMLEFVSLAVIISTECDGTSSFFLESSILEYESIHFVLDFIEILT